MTFTRKNVWELGGDWADPILWYARGVKAMQARKLDQPTSWGFYAAMHGINPDLWKMLGYPVQPTPKPGVQKTFWDQCQHGSWYFLPWHRGYLIAFEAVVRDAIVTLGGPKDWALPYWNYFKENKLPPAFATRSWPDRDGDNPLYIDARYGPNNDHNVYIPLNGVDLKALGDPDFTGTEGGDAGFGGLDTGFSHGGDTHGRLESQPHDMVHVFVGGGTQRKPGAMAIPDSAALDPIFWLHHCNVDRLWEVWREHPTTDADPSNPNWVNGPAAVGDRAFSMPMPDGSTWTFTPGDVSDYSKLNYVYDDVSAPTRSARPVARLVGLGASLTDAKALVRSKPVGPKTAELLGATKGMQLVGSGASASVALKASVKKKVTSSLMSLRSAAPQAPDRVFLNLHNVKGAHDGVAFQVYINVPDGKDPEKFPDHRAGSVGLFGVSKASLANDKHAGNGLTFVVEITDVVDKLHLSGNLSDNLHVRLVPTIPIPKDAAVSIGSISVSRQNG